MEREEAGGQAVRGRGDNGGPPDHHRGDVGLIGQGGHDIAHGDEAQIYENLTELFAALLLKLESALQVFFGDLLALNEQLPYTHQYSWT